MNSIEYYSASNLTKTITKLKELLFDLSDEKSQKLLKLIKYDSITPLEEDDLTYKDLNDLIDPQKKTRRIYNRSKTSEIQDEARTEFRVWVKTNPIGTKNKYLLETTILFQVVTHQDLLEIKLNDTDRYPFYRRDLQIYTLCNDILLGKESGGVGVFEVKNGLGYKEANYNNASNWTGCLFGLVVLNG